MDSKKQMNNSQDWEVKPITWLRLDIPYQKENTQVYIQGKPLTVGGHPVFGSCSIPLKGNNNSSICLL